MAKKETGDKKPARLQVTLLIIGWAIVGLPWLAILAENTFFMEPTWIEWAAEGDIYAYLVFFAPYLIFGFVLCTTKKLRIILPTTVFLVFAIFTQYILAMKAWYKLLG